MSKGREHVTKELETSKNKEVYKNNTHFHNFPKLLYYNGPYSVKIIMLHTTYKIISLVLIPGE